MIRPNAGPGLFLTLEGVDGAGKSSHLDWLTDRLRSRGLRVVSTREPGGTPLGEDLRQLLLQRPMRLRTETLLMFAARAEHLAQVIEPALRRGDWVVCDRFTDASYAYQGGGRELGEAAIAALEDWVHPHLQPDRTWLFDVPLEVAQARRAGAREADRFEAENAAFFERTRAAYLARAASSKGRILRVDATGTLDDVRAQLARDLDKLWEHHHV
ncbi:MAG: dTMP kinase [Pigmentiphaga sp.]|nr:dTMP kinase [Pigmentiphaga sp.]